MDAELESFLLQSAVKKESIDKLIQDEVSLRQLA